MSRNMNAPDSISCRTASDWRSAAMWKALPAVVSLLLLLTAAKADGQPPQLQGQARTSLKPKIERKDPVVPASIPSGDTYVGLASGLERVFRGYEPRTLEALKQLEAQQARVVDAIEKVTVNVQQGTAQGSGVIITASGFVLTAAHVAGKPGLRAKILFSDGREVQAETLGMNRDKDAGLLKITTPNSEPWPHATLGQVNDKNGSVLREGQWCVAAGYPGGFKSDRGVVIRVGRILDIMSSSKDGLPHTLLTDCALIGGDSGGPLFTLDGKLVGVHSRIGSEISENMHVPIDVFSAGWDRMAMGEVWGTLPGYKPVIGVRADPSDPRAIIKYVEPGGPAARAEILAGDVILSVDGKATPTFLDLQKAVQASLPGDTLVVILQRADQRLRVRVRVAADSQ